MVSRVCVLLVLVAGLGVPAAAADPLPQASEAMLLDDAASVELLEAGRRQLLAGYLVPAERTFRRLARRSDGRPAAYHHLATTSLLRVLLYDRPQDYDAFFSRSDSLREALDERGRSRGRQYLNAETDFQRSLAWAKQGSYVRAAMASVSAYRSLSDLVERDSTFHEAYKTLGMVHTTLGTLPRRYRRFLSIFGFETDIGQGLDQSQKAVDLSRYGREESLLFLSILDSFELPSTVNGIETLQRLRRENGNSPLFGLVLVDALLRSRRVDEADALLKELENPGAGRIDIDYLDFYRAEVLFKREEWGDAAVAYAAYRARHDGKALMAVAALRQGQALEMDGRRARAEQAYRQVIAARELDSDEASAREATEHLAHPMGELEKQLLEARVSHDRSDYSRADSLLEALADAITEATPRRYAEWAYRRARTLDETGRDIPAARFYRLAIDRPGDPSAKWAPYGMYYLARIHEDAGRRVEARSLYQAVVDYGPSYDYRGTNEQRARFGLRRLED